MEGVTFACRDAFAALQDAGANPERIVMAGGGSRSPFWRQMVADVFGLPVYALATTDQAAMGAALLAAAGSVARSGRNRPTLGTVRAANGAERGDARPL